MEHYFTPTSTSGSQSTNFLTVSGEFDTAQPITELRLPDGRIVQIPTSFLSKTTDVPDLAMRSDEVSVIPLISESLSVIKRTVPTGIVRLHKTVEEYDEALDEPLAVWTFDIERIVLNRVVDAAPGIRHEGDTTIYPVVEEQMVLTKQLVLKEEVHVTKRDSERRDTQVVTLRRERIDIEREPIS